MKIDNYNKSLKLINNKPNGNQMLENGYAFYMYPVPTIQYANKVLTPTERKLYFAICGQAGKDKDGKPYHWAMKHYCNIANIKSNHYLEPLKGLCKKGFLIHTAFESLEVLFPVSENEYISPNGKIVTRQDSKNSNDIYVETKIINEHDSQNGKSATKTVTNSDSQIEKEEYQKRNSDNIFGNSDSQNYGNNREIKINKEQIENFSPTIDNKYKENVINIVSQIGRKFNIENQVINQLENIRNKGFSYEFIFYALDKKKIEDFKTGLGLLFNESYQKEIQAILRDKKATEQKQKEILESIIKNNKPQQYRQVKYSSKAGRRTKQEKIFSPEELAEIYKEEERIKKEFQKREESRNVRLADLI